MGYVRNWSYVGVDPDVMGFGPAPAIRKGARKAGPQARPDRPLRDQRGVLGQFLSCEKDLGLDRDKVNVNGGAIGLGHPLGATGTRSSTRC